MTGPHPLLERSRSVQPESALPELGRTIDTELLVAPGRAIVNTCGFGVL
jgi:hypothetical protein